MYLNLGTFGAVPYSVLSLALRKLSVPGFFPSVRQSSKPFRWARSRGVQLLAAITTLTPEELYPLRRSRCTYGYTVPVTNHSLIHPSKAIELLRPNAELFTKGSHLILIRKPSLPHRTNPRPAAIPNYLGQWTSMLIPTYPAHIQSYIYLILKKRSEIRTREKRGYTQRRFSHRILFCSRSSCRRLL